MTHIIGIGGKLASGKDAIADYLVEKHGWAKLGMSDALAEALEVLNPHIPVENSVLGIISSTSWVRYKDYLSEHGYVKAKENPEVRRLLQVLGTQVGRELISESVWTDIVARRARTASRFAPGVIITGIRFPNELELISDDLEGELWWVNRPGLSLDSSSTHSSENSVAHYDFDRVIINDGTLEELYLKVDKILTLI